MVSQDMAEYMDVDVVVRELRGVLRAPHSSPEWRWNAHRRLAAATAAVPVPAQAGGGHDELSGRLDALRDGALDRLAAGTITREVRDLLDRLERHGGN